jgi:dynein heavy chain
LFFRWTEELANLKSDRERLVGDCLISASFLSYSGAFSWQFRRQMVYGDWELDLQDRNVPLSKSFRLEKTLANDSEIVR